MKKTDCNLDYWMGKVYILMVQHLSGSLVKLKLIERRGFIILYYILQAAW